MFYLTFCLEADNEGEAGRAGVMEIKKQFVFIYFLLKLLWQII